MQKHIINLYMRQNEMRPELVSVFKEEKIPEIKKKGLKKNEC
jgi:hypothetical protein